MWKSDLWPRQSSLKQRQRTAILRPKLRNLVKQIFVSKASCERCASIVLTRKCLSISAICHCEIKILLDRSTCLRLFVYHANTHLSLHIDSDFSLKRVLVANKWGRSNQCCSVHDAINNTDTLPVCHSALLRPSTSNLMNHSVGHKSYYRLQL